MPVEDLQALAGRPGWTLAGDRAIYQPTDGGGNAVVRTLQRPGHTYWWWHVAIVDEGGHAAYVTWTGSLGQAIREAEGRVR